MLFNRKMRLDLTRHRSRGLAAIEISSAGAAYLQYHADQFGPRYHSQDRYFTRLNSTGTEGHLINGTLTNLSRLTYLQDPKAD